MTSRTLPVASVAWVSGLFAASVAALGGISGVGSSPLRDATPADLATGTAPLPPSLAVGGVAVLLALAAAVICLALLLARGVRGGRSERY